MLRRNENQKRNYDKRAQIKNLDKIIDRKWFVFIVQKNLE